jgi:hypothetical protein
MLFACGLATTLLVSLLVIRYMHRPLGKLLEELCGNRERAEFWTVFSNVTVGLVPVIFAMQYEPEPGARALFEVSAQLKWGLIGLVTSILMLGWVVGRFIRRSTVPTTGVRS